MRKTYLYKGFILTVLCVSLLSSGCGKSESPQKADITTAAEKEGDAGNREQEAAGEETKAREKPGKGKKGKGSEADTPGIDKPGTVTPKAGGPEAAVPWFEAGEWNGNVYTNKQAGISVVLPDEWTAFTEDELKQVMNAGYDQLSDQQKMQYDLNMKYQQTVYDLGAAGKDGQSSLLFLVENLGKSPITARMDEEAYLDIVKSQMEQTQLSYTIDDIMEKEIAGDTWKVLSAECMGMVQWYAVHKEEQRMETFIITVPDSGRSQIEEILSGITGI